MSEFSRIFGGYDDSVSGLTGFWEGEAPNGAGLNLVTLLKLKGESNGEHKASLNIARVLSIRQ